MLVPGMQFGTNWVPFICRLVVLYNLNTWGNIYSVQYRACWTCWDSMVLTDRNIIEYSKWDFAGLDELPDAGSMILETACDPGIRLGLVDNSFGNSFDRLFDILVSCGGETIFDSIRPLMACWVFVISGNEPVASLLDDFCCVVGREGIDDVWHGDKRRWIGAGTSGWLTIRAYWAGMCLWLGFTDARNFGYDFLN
ncbi:hypothetical protein BYT27DRAFT_7215272 [Phlegmacium glaucopus]|nr:hypothetical protein BYT27DRAFT_7215272 [Phlegmacium glaucopus]